jgi:ABC-type molybdate transport system ATPase subunit
MYDNVGWFDNDSRLFDGTLRENLTMGRTSISIEEMEQALEVVQLTDFVKLNLKGFDMELGPRQEGISEEDRERILIARALTHHPELLLLCTDWLLTLQKLFRFSIELQPVIPTPQLYAQYQNIFRLNGTIINF